MKILSKKGFYQADEATLKSQNIKSEELMERAAIQVFGWLKTQLEEETPKFHVFCGIGNNGGDGLAVARLLLNDGYQVETHVVNFSEKRSDDFLLNLDRLKADKHWPGFLTERSDLPEIKPDEIIIDAVFGIGLNRPADAWVKKLLVHLNQVGAYILSLDLPSGLYLDAIPNEEDAVIKANTTISFQLPKLVFFLPQTGAYVGHLQIADIGLDAEAVAEIIPEAILIGSREARRLYKVRDKFTHKGTYGHTLLIGGSYGKLGSMVLATKAAMHIGAGKATALIPKCGYEILQSTIPEAMVITGEEPQFLEKTDYNFTPEAIAFGMGAGLHQKTAEFLESLLQHTKSPLLIDADGLNILAENKELLKLLPEKTILTPHPGELKRLIGSWDDDFDKLEKAKHFSKKHKIILVIKGAYSITVAQENLYVNTSGNAGMATAGSGDTLSGIISGLIAQGYDSVIAAVFGVYLHGRAGDLAVQKSGMEAIIATDLINHLGDAYLDLLTKDSQKK